MIGQQKDSVPGGLREDRGSDVNEKLWTNAAGRVELCCCISTSVAILYMHYMYSESDMY